MHDDAAPARRAPHAGRGPGAQAPAPTQRAGTLRRRRTAAGAAVAAASLALGGCGLLPWSLPAPSGTAPSSTAPSSSAPASSPVPSSSDAPAPGWVRPGEVRVGACVDTSNGLRFSTFQLVDCEQMHDGQVVAQGVIGGTSLPDDDDDDAWQRLYDRQCTPAFAEFTGTSWDDSRLSMYYWVPTEQEFKDGYRSLTCVIQMNDGTRFSGSALGKNNEEQFKHGPGWKAPTDEDLYSDEPETHRV